MSTKLDAVARNYARYKLRQATHIDLDDLVSWAETEADEDDYAFVAGLSDEQFAEMQDVYVHHLTREAGE